MRAEATDLDASVHLVPVVYYALPSPDAVFLLAPSAASSHHALHSRNFIFHVLAYVSTGKRHFRSACATYISLNNFWHIQFAQSVKVHPDCTSGRFSTSRRSCRLLRFLLYLGSWDNTNESMRFDAGICLWSLVRGPSKGSDSKTSKS